MHLVQSISQKVIVSAFTGIAASLLDGGTTLHSRFKLPKNIDETTTCRLTREEKKQILEASVLIIDEAPMCSINLIDCLDREMKDLCKSNKLFGGKTVVFGGDFRQTLPVMKNAKPAQITAVCLKKWKNWQFVRKRKLTKNMRTAPGQIEFSKYLLEMGNGQIEPIDRNDLIKMENDIVCETDDELIDFVYGQQKPIPIASLTDGNKAILAPLNDDVNEINELILERLPG
jgi:hypothetical protein